MSTYTPIASQTVSGSASTITFNNIPQNFTDLVLVMSGTHSQLSSFYIQFNNTPSTTNYSTTIISGNGSSVSSFGQTSQDGILNGVVDTTMSQQITHIMNYSNSSTNKAVITRGGVTTFATRTFVGLWRSTDAINSLTLYPGAGTLSAGTTINLYGIQSGNALATKATGGNIITTDGTYWYHTFTSSGYFAPTQTLSCDYLVVAGGGAGGDSSSNSGGGGGAGGLRSTVTATGGGGSLESALSLTAQTYTVIVGAGGAFTANNVGRNGSNSVFSTITSIGGGGGASQSAQGDGVSGGSGGGACYFTSSTHSGGAGTANQGFRGGNKASSGNAQAAGGGGAGAQGVDCVGTAQQATNGGDGVAVSITGSSVIYAGGGGGGAQAIGNTSGGSGGGGAGSQNGTAVSGTANLGGGGGGAAITGNAGNGGSGIVIVRYLV